MSILQSSSARRAGFTLVELLIALAISSLVGLGVALMLGGMGSATRSQFDVRRSGIKRQVAIVRLGSLTRSAAMVLADNVKHLVLWKGDANGDDSPNLSELRRIEWDSDSAEIRSYESPQGLDPSLDETFALDADFSAVTDARAGSAVFPGQVALQDVVQWTLHLDGPDGPSSRLIRLQVTLDCEDGVNDVTVISALRVLEQTP